MAVTIRNLQKRYGDVVALHDVSVDAPDGAVTGFLGRNGAGKSTAMRCLMGLARPDGGKALVDGRPYDRLEKPARQVGALLDAEAHHPARSGRDHLRVLADAAGLSENRVVTALATVELSGAADRPIKGYSLGMRQRLHLAAALLGDPGTLVLDEPTNGLDPPGIQWLRNLLRALAAEGRCVLLSSHVLGEVAQTVDGVVIVAGGRMVAAGPLREVFATTPTALRVRCDDPARLARAVREAFGAQLDPPATGTGDIDDLTAWWRVDGVPAVQLARLARSLDVLVTGLHEEEPDLEARFMALTAPKVEAA